MADNYGVTFAQKLIQQGNYEEAILAANKHLVQDPASPEPYHDRARALAGLGRFEEAVADYAQAIQRDETEHVLQDWEVDDGLFSLLVAWAQSLGEAGKASAAQVAIMERYAQLLPSGQHRADAADWILRFKGLLKSTFVKQH
jgi:tetratricopeptide (TPR) repeat protein